MGAPPPGPRPAPCALAALFWRRFNSRPREKLSSARHPAPHAHPEPRPGREPGVALPRGAIVCAARPPPAGAAQGGSLRVPGAAAAAAALPPALPGPAVPVRPPRAARGSGSRLHTPGKPTARDPPGHAAAAAATPPRAPRPTRPPSLRTGLHTQQVSLTRRTGGRTHREKSPPPSSPRPPWAPAPAFPTRPRFTTTGGPRPGVRPAGRPTPRRGSARGTRLGRAAEAVPTPPASPEGAKWREGAGRAAAAAPRKTMWVNEGRRLPPQRKYGQAPLPH